MDRTKQVDLQKIIEQCIAQDRKYQKLLYERYFGIMMKIAIRYTENWDEAMEVVNTGFHKIFTKIADYEGLGSFEGWMKRIVINTSLDYLKKSQSKNIELDDRVAFDSNYFIDNDAISDFSVEDILKTVQSLPPMTRAVFNLYVLEGYKHHDISVELGISEGTSHWHLQNARKLLQAKLKRF
jgi:RNA polymerase sigma-70 factor (ECF subfamily)